MNKLTVVKTLSCLALFGALFAPSAQADAWNRKTTVTFSAPVEIPGVHLEGWGILPAGTYVFKILDSQSDRHIVQISNKEETTVYATVLAIPNYRIQATDKTVMTFAERAAGEPEALRAWFYPGRNWGEEFVYPKSRALAIAKATNTPVLYTPVELPKEVAKPILTRDEPIVTELKRAPIMAIQPSGEEVTVAAVVTPPPAAELQDEPAKPSAAQPAPSRAAAVDNLPSTASELPLLGMLGLFAVAGAFTVRAIVNYNA
jgi:hypothetical protein